MSENHKNDLYCVACLYKRSGCGLCNTRIEEGAGVTVPCDYQYKKWDDTTIEELIEELETYLSVLRGMQ